MMVSQGLCVMRYNLLILGGTRQASSLATYLADRNIPATLSYAGRVARVKPQAVNVRIGGFGGSEGLAAYLSQNQITHLIDATHPFAAQISQNACEAAARAGIPLVRFSRPEWTPQDGDRWHEVADIASAVQYLDQPRRRVMLALGRLNLPAFEIMNQHFYLLRLVDAPDSLPGFSDYKMVLSRGPFHVDEDKALLEAHHIDLIISKNAGGEGAIAKLDAARALGIEVVMISRPLLPECDEVTDIAGLMGWLGQSDG